MDMSYRPISARTSSCHPRFCGSLQTLSYLPQPAQPGTQARYQSPIHPSKATKTHQSQIPDGSMADEGLL